jgi:hypothetical protein
MIRAIATATAHHPQNRGAVRDPTGTLPEHFGNQGWRFARKMRQMHHS